MRIEAPRRIARPIPLTPLIDVVFLLLMFFMLSTTFAKFGLFGMGGGQGSDTSASTGGEQAFPDIIVEVSAGPRIKVNGAAVTLSGLTARLDSLQAIGLSSAAIRMRSDASVQDMLSVLEVARRSKLPSLALSH